MAGWKPAPLLRRALFDSMKFSRRWLWLLLLVPIALGLARLRFDVEVLNLLPEKSGMVRGLKLYQQNFSNGRELIITLRSDDADKTEAASRSLAAALRHETNLVSEVNWQPAWLEYPSQSAELVAFLWLNQPPEIFAQLTNRLAPENLSATLAETKEQLATSLSPQEIAMRSYDPFNLMRLPESVSSAMPIGTGDELFSSADGRFRLVFVEAATDLRSYRACEAWLNSVTAIIAQRQRSGEINPEAKISYTGRPAFVSEIAGGMQHDMFASVGGTMLIIALLFWIAHRRFRPLVWILVLLVVILGGTMALGGLFFGTLNVVSMGFAAILLGLAVDYGLVLYQEAQAAPHLSARQIRLEITPSILWSAVTTAGAFAILNLSGLPGLGQLGSLVAIGVVLAGFVMLFAYLPPLKRAAEILSAENRTEDSAERTAGAHLATRSKFIWAVTILILLTAALVLWKKPLRFDYSPDALRPKNSPAYTAVEEIKRSLGRTDEPLWIIAPGRDETEVARRLHYTESVLSRAVSNQLISSFTMPTTLWPQPQNQLSNRVALKSLTAEKEQLRNAAISSGFTSNSFALTEKLFETWQTVSEQTNIFWPTNDASRWLLEKVVARVPDGFLAVGLVYPKTDSSSEKALTNTRFAANVLTPELEREGIILSGWTLIGTAMFDLVKKDFPRVLLPMLALLLFSLWLAFRRLSEVFLSLATLIFTGVVLLLFMSLANWSWNLLNLMAVPLLLGAGVDYSIHMQLALRRHGGNIFQVRRSIGRALWLCGGTTITGFGSLAFSNNAGLASLGQVCATGIAASMLTSIYLLPIWWKTWSGQEIRGEKIPAQ